MEARPTEYKGVLYRSKSEAMFARWLDLSSKSQFFYEPIGFPKCVDFLAIEHAAEMIPYGIVLQPSYAAIQYKPSRPTRAYVAEMDREKDAIFQACEDIHPGQSLCCLMYGSVWSDSRGMFIFRSGEHPHEVTDDWLEPCRLAVMDYRYDLEETA